MAEREEYGDSRIGSGRIQEPGSVHSGNVAQQHDSAARAQNQVACPRRAQTIRT